MEDITEKLGSLGWNFTVNGFQKVSENGYITDANKLVRNALDLDLREIGAGSFPQDIGKGRLETTPGKFVVQVQKMRNVSAPKVNEESRAAPRLLKLYLTDGVTICQAIEVISIPFLSLNTPPGTKLFLKAKSLPVVQGIILLGPSSVEVLGGKVAALVEKWELSRKFEKHTRGQIGEGGPPPWIPFGQHILRTNQRDRSFKAFDGNKSELQYPVNAEFESQRKDEIAEAARSGSKKVFGGGMKPLLDFNLQQLVDYGFSVAQAEHALRVTGNNATRALHILQKREERHRPNTCETEEPRDRRESHKTGDREERVATPSTRVFLFDFLQDKLPPQHEEEVAESRSHRGGYSTGYKKIPYPGRRGGGWKPFK